MRGRDGGALLGRRLAGVVTALAVLGLPGPAVQAGPLDRVMGVMEEDYQALGRALFREDYDRAREAAASLADHPTPGLAEKLALAARLGTAGRFREYDTEVREAARDIARAAEARSLDRMTDGYHRLTEGCLVCHRQFGEQIAEGAADG